MRERWAVAVRKIAFECLQRGTKHYSVAMFMRKASNDSWVNVCREILSLAGSEEFQKARGNQNEIQGDWIHIKEVVGRTPPDCYEIP